jgi:CelD/BcsL family acetyltransferase involved in cellulose biosynthesis
VSRILIAQSRPELERLRHPWQRLFNLTSGNTLFQRFDWNALAAEVFSEREQSYVVFAETDDGAALVPACIAGGELRLLGETLFDYRAPLTTSAQALAAAWGELAALGRPLRVEALRGTEAPDWGALACELFARAPFVAGLTADQFLARHARARRLLRKWEERGAAVRREDGRSRHLESIYRQKAETTPASLFRDPVRIEFMLRIARANPTACDVFLLDMKGRLAAAIVTFRDERWRRFYTMYHDQEFAALSPGTTVLFAATVESLREGFRCDYMTGEQGYKLRFATGSFPLWRLTASAQQLRDETQPRILRVA